MKSRYENEKILRYDDYDKIRKITEEKTQQINNNIGQAIKKLHDDNHFQIDNIEGSINQIKMDIEQETINRESGI